ncbi:MAG: winged helix-turn-helix transcriptional regulator [Candidatus Hydrothermarchaeales archaeon]
MNKLIEVVSRKGAEEILHLLEDEGKYYMQIETNVGLNSRTLVTRLRELSKIGLIERKVRDNRRVLYSITERGRRAVEKLREFQKI